MTQTKQRMTYADLRAMPEDRNRYEIIEGELFVSPAPRTVHQRVILNLAHGLRNFLDQHPVGVVYVAPTDVYFTELDAVQPDLLVVLKNRSSIIGEDCVKGAPDIAIEVLSESSRRTDWEEKFRLYERHGVKEYWIVDPDAFTLHLFELREAKFQLRALLRRPEAIESGVLPGLRIELQRAFE